MNLEKTNNANKNIESTKGKYYQSPYVDIYENESDYIMYFDIPGVEKDKINVKVEKDVLTLVAESSKEADTDYRVVREEMNYDGYKRSFELSNTVDVEKIAADYTDGTLKLTLPKREEQKTKEVKINVA